MSTQKGMLAGENTSLFRLAKWLTAETAEALELTTDQWHVLSAEQLFRWGNENIEYIRTTLADPSIRSRMKITDDAEARFLEFLECPFRFMRFVLPIWHTLVFAPQKPLLKPVTEVRVVVAVVFADGEAGQIAAVTEIPEEFQQAHGMITNSLRAAAVGLIDRLGPGKLAGFVDSNQSFPELPPVGRAPASILYLGL